MKFHTQIPILMPNGTVEHCFGPEVLARSRKDAIFVLGVMGVEGCLIYPVQLVELVPSELDRVRWN